MSLDSAIPVLRVADYARARKFYEALGFTCSEEGGEPPRFGIFHQGAAIVFLDGWHGADAAPSPGWRAYFHVRDVDALARRLGAAGVALDGPRTTAYGMRELVVTDPAGNRLCFGQDIPG